jgi:CheY-like chemotaxis protein
MQTKSALVVDDSKVARLTLGKLLQTHGFEITEKGSAEEALQWIQNTVSKPDLIFMDVMMGGMDGLTATRQIKENPDWTEVPVIICTGKETEEDLKQALASGATAVLAKPPAAEAVQKLLVDVGTTARAEAQQQVPAEPNAIPTDTLVADIRAQLLPELEQKLNASLSDMQQQLARQQQQQAEPQSGLDKLAELNRQMSESVQQQFGELSQRFSATTEQRVSELAKKAIDSAVTNFGLADKLNQAIRDEASGWLSQQQADIHEQLTQELKQTLHADIDSYLNEQLNYRVQELVEQHWQTLQSSQPQQHPEQNDQALRSQLAMQRNIAIGAGLLAIAAIILAFV